MIISEENFAPITIGMIFKIPKKNIINKLKDMANTLPHAYFLTRPKIIKKEYKIMNNANILYPHIISVIFKNSG